MRLETQVSDPSLYIKSLNLTLLDARVLPPNALCLRHVAFKVREPHLNRLLSSGLLSSVVILVTRFAFIPMYFCRSPLLCPATTGYRRIWLRVNLRFTSGCPWIQTGCSS